MKGFHIKSRMFCLVGYFDSPFWFFAIQIGWRYWQWWEIVFAHDGIRAAHLDLRSFRQ